MNCIRVAREGGTIAMAPEGNRTFGGSTGYMNNAIVPLAKKLGLPTNLSSNAMISAINMLYAHDEYDTFVKELNDEGNN